MGAGDRYLHGTSAEEHDRLELMNGILNVPALRELALAGGERVLDLGAGTALFSRAMAGALPEGRVVAVELDAQQLARARRVAAGTGNLELRQGDAADPPLGEGEWGSFDVVHARFLLEHVESPLDVVRVMVRAARPGGRIVLVDDDHSLMRLWPPSPEFDRLWGIYTRQYGALGYDGDVGRRLISLLHDAGAKPRRASMLFYGGCSGEPVFGSIVENVAMLFEGVSERIAATGDMDLEQVTAAVAAVRAWGRREDAALWYALPWAEAMAPEEA